MNVGVNLELNNLPIHIRKNMRKRAIGFFLTARTINKTEKAVFTLDWHECNFVFCIKSINGGFDGALIATKCAVHDVATPFFDKRRRVFAGKHNHTSVVWRSSMSDIFEQCHDIVASERFGGNVNEGLHSLSNENVRVHENQVLVFGRHQLKHFGLQPLDLQSIALVLGKFDPNDDAKLQRKNVVNVLYARKNVYCFPTHSILAHNQIIGNDWQIEPANRTTTFLCSVTLVKSNAQ